MKRQASLIAVAALLLGGCTFVPKTDETPVDPGQPVGITLPPAQQAELDELISEINDAANMTVATFEAAYPVPFVDELPYQPGTAEHLPLIQASAMALTDGETARLGENGFVISEAKRFPSFIYGYETIYAEDLPVFISADSILFAVHRSYDEILKSIELAALIPDLREMLIEMREALSAGGAAMLGEQARADADVYLAVALSLLDANIAPPVAGGDEAEILVLTTGATIATGMHHTEIFGVDRRVDFSQFKPRGHYTDSEMLERYFRSMMWLGRIDFRMLEAQEDLSLLFRRRQLEGALALGELIEAGTQARWVRIDDVIGAFVGESDYMTLPELDYLLGDLGLGDDLAALAGIDDETIAQAITDGGYGTQRISSHIMINGVGKGTMPLSSSFALFGQRYVLDSHVFSNVVYDRVQGGSVYRMMPDPLDVAFAALSNNQAGGLLHDQLEQYQYASDLHLMRLLADKHPADYWAANLYNLWLSSLRALSPSPEVFVDAPAIVATEKWGRRVLNAQLASWAELRHDTILYAKQSYTAGSVCEYPDAYVEPNPQFFAGIADFAGRGRELAATLDFGQSTWLGQQIYDYFGTLGDVATMLEQMATYQQTGTPFDAEQMAFINQTVAVQMGCGEPMGAEGWYADLFFSPVTGVEADPTIADVHTQPTDAGGAMVGHVLHVGTGYPRLMVVTVETCTGPRAYVGLASSYFERITKDFERLDDQTWADQIETATPPDVSWMTDLVVR